MKNAKLSGVPKVFGEKMKKEKCKMRSLAESPKHLGNDLGLQSKQSPNRMLGMISRLMENKKINFNNTNS